MIFSLHALAVANSSENQPAYPVCKYCEMQLYFEIGVGRSSDASVFTNTHALSYRQLAAVKILIHMVIIMLTGKSTKCLGA